MARLTTEQWEKVRADWCTGAYTYQSLSDFHGVSDAAIIKRKTKEGWEKLPHDVVENYIEARAETKSAIDKVSKVSKVSATNLEDSLERLAIRKHRAEDIGMNLLEAVDKGISRAEDAKDIKELSTAFKSVYEPLFKITPDTAIQINNTQPSNALTGEDLRRELDKRGINSEVFD